MKTTVLILSWAAMLFTSVASQAQSNAHTAFDVSPVVMDGKNDTGATVGLEYKLKGALLSRSFESKDSGNTLNPNATVGGVEIGYSANGTVAASKERNPRNFLEFVLDAKLRYGTSGGGTVLGGGFAKYETDQSFANKQFVFGLGGTYGKYAVFRENDFIAFDANYGRVDPKEDAQREVVLGTTSLDPYYRWNLELLYMLPIHTAKVKSIEFNYRYFRETNAPAAIKSASLDEQQLGTVRVGLDKDLFLAYSAGKLPFDRRNDQVVQIGFSYKLK